jgi:hypothetical protein
LVDRPPAGPGWLHEIKHDGFRILALKQGGRVQVWSRRAADFTYRFPAIAKAVGDAQSGFLLFDQSGYPDQVLTRMRVASYEAALGLLEREQLANQLTDFLWVGITEFGHSHVDQVPPAARHHSAGRLAA